MAVNENRPGGGRRPIARRESRLPGNLHPLHEAALRIADIGLSRPSAKTKDLVGVLLVHGARAWRSTHDPVSIHLYVTGLSRRPILRLRLR
ncbi:hypothetical protein SAMN05880582_101840 [Rhizobium sp. RU20A]|uniref:hypothetical protein n=1 Tax=Rhizobium sp. RU20A TaxID=1907412 RepID=UPI0009543966|nr:hypothetical protein [Rhizobium sp. RU20A]SIQ12742.1 hypothetical protein SAMN05880582_101840 [Rhizobium sp. RU20A]